MIVYPPSMRWLLVVALGGCGFHGLPSDDLGTLDLAGSDLVGVDLAGADLTVPSGPTGPGPLGALPAGFCCASNGECRSRACRSLGGGPKVCTDECSSDELCAAWSPDFHCDTTAGVCVPNGATSTCLAASSYHYGEKTIGACCASGFVKAGQGVRGRAVRGHRQRRQPVLLHAGL